MGENGYTVRNAEENNGRSDQNDLKRQVNKQILYHICFFLVLSESYKFLVNSDFRNFAVLAGDAIDKHNKGRANIERKQRNKNKSLEGPTQPLMLRAGLRQTYKGCDN